MHCFITEQRAAKNYECTDCGDIILRGERYTKVAWVGVKNLKDEDGNELVLVGPSTEKVCSVCARKRMLYPNAEARKEAQIGAIGGHFKGHLSKMGANNP